ncbi:MAG TPA: toprim domain-containing protein [Candidatus Norongarragalinales archaeon]|nr:toprim domain-containing protein [Candidatus Norongarragalinales archaeon]
MGITQDKFLKKILLELKNGLLLVEGKNDLEALKELGIAGNVILANGQNEQIVENALSKLEKGQKLILLFDLDAEGERKTQFFRGQFLGEGVDADIEMRKMVRALFGITTMEELPRAYNDLLAELEL